MRSLQSALAALISIVCSSSTAVSAEFTIAAGVTSADSNTEDPGRPAVASDGANYLVVSCRELGALPGLVGVTVTGQGVVGAPFPIAAINPILGCSGSRPAVAFDGSNYLVVFGREGQILGTRVSPAGNSLDGPDGFPISSGTPFVITNFNPSVAFDGSQFLVVWQKFIDSTHDIYAARVSTSANVSAEIPVFEGPGTQVDPTVAFDGVNFLIVWEDSGDIFGARVAPNGTVLAPAPFPISAASGIQSLPHVAFGGSRYLVVWQDNRNNPGASFPPGLDVFGARIDPDGTLLDGPATTGGIAINTAPHPKQHARVAFDGTDYRVFWDASFFYEPPVGIYTARISSNGTLIDGPPDVEAPLLSQPSCFACRLVFPDVSTNGITPLVAWVLNTEVSSQVKDIVGTLLATEPADSDGDGFPEGEDCNDGDPAINPLAPDLPGNLIDENCDESIACSPAASYRNHGHFVRCVSRACGELVSHERVTAAECNEIVSGAARSTVGR